MSTSSSPEKQSDYDTVLGTDYNNAALIIININKKILVLHAISRKTVKNCESRNREVNKYWEILNYSILSSVSISSRPKRNVIMISKYNRKCSTQLIVPTNQNQEELIPRPSRL